MDTYSFYTGHSFDCYEFLGAHPYNGGFFFRTFAPSASRITLIGEFSDWNEIEMYRIMDGNFFEAYVSGAKCGMRYLFRIYDKAGNYTEHNDIYGFYTDLRPGFCSVLCDPYHEFQDSKWLSERNDRKGEALNIYEMHLGSWIRKPDGSFYSYDELADKLIPYLKKSGYNYIEFLPISEHPCDESWGYQTTCFFAPTSRYGEPKALKRLIDKCHQNSIGVIMDFVPVHFASDSYGISKYDSSYLYEYPSGDVGVSEWGSCNFNHSRGEVRSFLQSCAHYYLKEYHFDGIRMDAISRIIYWQGDERRGVNTGGIEFLKVMNKGLKERFPTAILIAEDSTNYTGCTRSVNDGGLGFDYKWDMGFMNDTLSYFQMPQSERRVNQQKLTFSMFYYYSEHYLLPFSHDENVHGKATILQKMNGDYETKFPEARALYLYMYAHPGKKLNFMGGEFGQLREWDEKREQDWDILKYPNHDGFYSYMKLLNSIYLSHGALFEKDYDPSGFSWIEFNAESGIYAFYRFGLSETLIALFNLGDVPRVYTIEENTAEVLINTDWQSFGGKTPEKKSISLSDITLPPFSGMLLKPALS